MLVRFKNKTFRIELRQFADVSNKADAVFDSVPSNPHPPKRMMIGGD